AIKFTFRTIYISTNSSLIFIPQTFFSEEIITLGISPTTAKLLHVRMQISHVFLKSICLA
ncbi:hypothetical protein, partial [Escherichia coli]|uniref:hypothetical protein n=1 Tax=Escherichia coli TaxID=562 RepID=UPI001CD9C89A